MSYTYSAVRRLDFTAGKFAPGPEKPECVLSTDRRSGPYLCQSHSLGLERLRLRQDLREVLFCCLTRERRRRRREGSQEGRPQLKFPLCLCLEASLAVAWETVRSPRMHFIIHTGTRMANIHFWVEMNSVSMKAKTIDYGGSGKRRPE